MEAIQKKQLRIGLLGFGSMGRTHTWAVQNIPFFYKETPFEAITAGVCTTSLEKSERVAKAFHIAQVYASEDDLINDPSIDIIDICTPNLYHYETLKKAIAAGKHILCEKPLCIRLEDIDRILDAEKNSQAMLGVCHQNRYNPCNMYVKDYLKDKKLLGA